MISKKEKRTLRLKLELSKVGTMVTLVGTLLFVFLLIVDLGGQTEGISGTQFVASFGVPTLFYPRGTLLILSILSVLSLSLSTYKFLAYDREYIFMRVRKVMEETRYGKMGGRIELGKELDIVIDPKAKPIEMLHFEKQKPEQNEEGKQDDNLPGLI